MKRLRADVTSLTTPPSHHPKPPRQKIPLLLFTVTRATLPPEKKRFRRVSECWWARTVPTTRDRVEGVILHGLVTRLDRRRIFCRGIGKTKFFVTSSVGTQIRQLAARLAVQVECELKRLPLQPEFFCPPTNSNPQTTPPYNPIFPRARFPT